ncbi:MAG TPA: hypothetical protein VFC79_06625, partial [Tissierellaceae bacterium]|nr:hypothetical protein [Tissierellaceae bacterium]
MDGNKVVWADGVDFDEFVVFNKVSGKYLVDFNDDEYDVKDYLMVKDGKTVKADALKEGDVVFLYNNDYFDYDGLGVVATNMKEGVVTKAYQESFRLDGDLYELAIDAQYLDNKEQGDIGVDGKILADFEDEAEKITVVLDFKGDAVLMYGTRGIGSTLGAILTKDAKVFLSRGDKKIAWDLVNELGEEVSFDEDADEDAEITTTVADQWAVVEYTLESDGDLDSIVNLQDEDGGVTFKKNAEGDAKVEFDDKYAKGFRLTSNTVVFLVDDGDDEEVDEVFLWKDVKDYFNDATRYDVYAEDGDVTYLVVYDSDAGDEEAGIVVDTRKISNKKTEYKINIEGKEYRFDHDTEEGIEIGSIVVFDINEKMDEIKNLRQAEPPKLISGVADEIKTATRILDIDDETFNLTRNAVIFDVNEDDVINLRDLKSGSMVKAYKDSDRFVSYIVVEDVEDPEPATGWKLEYTPTEGIPASKSAIVVKPATGVTDLEDKYVVIIEGFDPELVKGYDVNPTVWMAVFVDED